MMQTSFSGVTYKSSQWNAFFKDEMRDQRIVCSNSVVITVVHVVIKNEGYISLHYIFEQVQVTQEKPKIGPADLASSLGGALGLWMGVSVLSICELIEVALKLSGYCRKKTKTKQINVTPAENVKSEKLKL